jgi:glutathione-regulated potassium-efflux system protein KefB
VDEPVRETFHSSLKMTRKTLEALGMPHEQAVDRVERFRRHDEKLLKTQYLVYDDETRLVQTSIEALSDLQKLLDADMAPEAAQERQSAAQVAAADPD